MPSSSQRTKLSRRLKNVRKELARIDESFKESRNAKPRLSVMNDEGGSGGVPRQRIFVDSSFYAAGSTEGADRARRVKRSRFSNYFASSYESGRPLRQERRRQRNRALVMLLFAMMCLFWVVHRFVL